MIIPKELKSIKHEGGRINDMLDKILDIMFILSICLTIFFGIRILFF